MTFNCCPKCGSRVYQRWTGFGDFRYSCGAPLCNWHEKKAGCCPTCNLQEAIKNMKETLAICEEAKAAGYPGASREIVEATRKLTLKRLKAFQKELESS